MPNVSPCPHLVQFWSKCKLCRRASYTEWAKANPSKRKASKVSSAQKPENKRRRAEHMKDYRLRFPDAYQNWVDQNPHKANANWNKRRDNFKAANLYEVSKKEIQKLYGSDCFYCQSSSKIQIDHIIPISRGGKHSIGNLVAACQSCNLNKKAKTIMEWRIWKNESKRIL